MVALFEKSGPYAVILPSLLMEAFLIFSVGIGELCSIELTNFFASLFTGDAWNIKQLRAKSSEDLHKLW